MLILILFMYVFSFPIIEGLPFHLSSARLIYLLILPFFLLNKKWQSISIKLMKNKKVIVIFLGLIFIVFYTLFVSTIYNTYDYSIVSPFVNQIIALMFGAVIFSLFILKNKVHDIPKYLIYIFIIQSIIQFFSFISPEIRNLLNIFRSDGTILLSEKYNYIRGLAISGGQFFGLGVGFGLVFIIYSYFWNDIFKKVCILKYLSLIFLFFGAMSAARSSLAGLAIAVFYFIVNKYKKIQLKFNTRIKINFNNIILVFLLIISVSFAIHFINLDSITDKFFNMSNFAFEFVYNFIDDGELSTSSTDLLFNRMYFKVPVKTFFIGDGFYTGLDGYYYMHTDAGYMRNILYFGIIGFIVLLVYQAQFFIWRSTSIA